MKRLLALTTVLSILFFCGCNPIAPSYQQPVDFYYLTTEDFETDTGVFAVKTVEGAAFCDDTIAMLNSYFKGQVASNTKFPFPYGLRVISLEISDNTAALTLDRLFGVLEGIDLTLACACITLTLCEHLQIDTVTISAESTTLGGKAFITMQKDSLLIRDDTPIDAAVLE